METFFTADNHFDHGNILKHCRRPWLKPGDLDDGKWVSKEIEQARVDEMNEGMVDKWNAVVGRKDTVYIIGDFAYKRHGRWVNALNGKKILITGNHDKMSQTIYDQFSLVYGREDGAFGSVMKFIDRIPVHMAHFPHRSWDRSHYGAWHLHGHVHGRMAASLPGPDVRNGLCLDVGVDVWDYVPVPWETIKKEMKVKENSLSDRGRRFKRGR